MRAEIRNRRSRDFFVPLFSPLVSSLSVCLSVPLCLTLQSLHQLKQIQTLKQMNEQLQAENRALTRVVARLSESTEPAEPQGP